VVLLFAAVVNVALGVLTVDEQTLNVGQEPCVRLFNAKGTVGCGTGRAGTTNPLFNIKDDATMSEFVTSGKDSSAILLQSTLFTKENVEKIAGTGRVGGIMVYDPSDNYKPEAGFSPAPLNNPYNPGATGFSGDNFKNVPIVKVDQETVEKLLDMAQRNKNQRDSTMLLPTFMTKFIFYMGGEGKVPLEDITSASCLTWKNFKGNGSPQCQPLGGLSTWASTEPLVAKPTKKVIMATTNIDGSSLFHELVPAANAAASGVVAILAAAEALSGVNLQKNGVLKMVPDLKNAIAYSLFQGETWDQIGSRMFVNDIQRFQTAATCEVPVDAKASPTGEEMCLNPLRRSMAFKQLAGAKVQTVIAVEQVGIQAAPAGTSKLYLHPLTVSTEELSVDIADKACAASKCDGSLTAPTGLPPPTPADSFTKLRTKDGSAGSFNSIVMSRYGLQYAEPNYFQSQYDNISATGPTFDAFSANVADAATQLARTLYYLADNNSTSASELNKIKVNASLVGELVTCIIGNWECDLMNSYLASTYFNLYKSGKFEAFPQFDIVPSNSETKPSLYTSVASISTIPFNIPYVRLAVQGVENWITLLPKCKPADCIKSALAPNANVKYSLDTCSCGGYKLQNDTTSEEFGLLYNENNEPVRIEEWPKSTYEAFLRSFLVVHTTSDRTEVACDNTLDCLRDKTIGSGKPDDGTTNYECVNNAYDRDSGLVTAKGVCVLPSAYHHLALSPAIEPERDGVFFNVSNTICTDPDTKWICNSYKEDAKGVWTKAAASDADGELVEMMWTEPNWLADIGVTIYPDGGDAIAWISLVFGLVVMAASVVASGRISAALAKQKLL
jgi:nicastrin